MVGLERPVFSRGRKRLEREMHRLIREKRKLFGGGEGQGQLLYWRAFFQRDENEIRTPTNFREGEKSWHGKWALWERTEAAVWLHLEWAGPLPAWGELPSPVPMREGEPTGPRPAPPHPHWIASNWVSCWLCF